MAPESNVKSETKRKPSAAKRVITEHQRSRRGKVAHMLVAGCESEFGFVDDTVKPGVTYSWQLITK
jgi:hypothetical protein